MNTQTDKPLILQAIDELENLNREKAVALLREDMKSTQGSGQHWLNVATLAGNIAERLLEIEAMRRHVQMSERTLDRLLNYCQALSKIGRSEEALLLIDALPDKVQTHFSLLYYRGVVAREVGDFTKAEGYFRQTLAAFPQCAEAWLGLAVLKTFVPGDPDIVAMETVRSQLAPNPMTQSQYLTALAKAYDDIGDQANAQQVLGESAALMAKNNPYDASAWRNFAAGIAREYTHESLRQFLPSECKSDRVMFVTGLPRSGTTLVEQILTSHSAVMHAGELNLMSAALLDTGDYSLGGALAYQARLSSNDPWGDFGRNYLRMVSDQFGAEGRVVDKSLSQSQWAGLLLQSLPEAKIVWLRRKPEDCALSIYRTYFPPSMSWAWSIETIAQHMRGEDVLYKHWADLFPKRILTVPYEELVSSPEIWIRKILAHVGLSEEAQVFEPHKNKRSVMTASVAQVRGSISTSRIGAADVYSDFVRKFRQSYSS